MTDENTHIINDANNNINTEEKTERKNKLSDKQKSTLKNSGFVAGGFAAGTASGIGISSATAANGEQSKEKATEPITAENTEDNSLKQDSNPIVTTTEEANNTDTKAQESEESLSEEIQAEEVQNNLTINNVHIHYHEDKTAENTSENIETTAETLESNGIHTAQVNDDMSFEQAFASARSQVGPNGIFEWHGKTYNTFYKSEWDNMSSQEKNDFISMLNPNSVEGGTDEVKIIHNDDVVINDGHSETDSVIVDLDGDGEIDMVLADVNHDGIIQLDEILMFDNENLSDSDDKIISKFYGSTPDEDDSITDDPLDLTPDDAGMQFDNGMDAGLV